MFDDERMTLGNARRVARRKAQAHGWCVVRVRLEGMAEVDFPRGAPPKSKHVGGPPKSKRSGGTKVSNKGAKVSVPKTPVLNSKFSITPEV